MGKKRPLLITISILVIFGLLFILISILVYPVYPSFQKEVPTLTEIKAGLKEAVFPKIDEAFGIETSHMLILDGRTIVAKPVGYVIGSVKAGESDHIQFSFRGRCNGGRELTREEQDYRGVGIGIAYGKDAVDPMRSYCVMLQFRCDNWVYDLSGTYTRDMKREKPNNQLTQEAKQIIEQMEDCLLELCYGMIDEALEN